MFSLLWRAALPAAGLGSGPVQGHHYVLAGRTAPGDVDGPGLLARFGEPGPLALDAQGDRLYVLDTGLAKLRCVDLATGVVSSLGPQGPAKPLALAWDPAQGRLLVLDEAPIRVLEWTPAKGYRPMAALPQAAAAGLGSVAAFGGAVLYLDWGRGLSWRLKADQSGWDEGPRLPAVAAGTRLMDVGGLPVLASPQGLFGLDPKAAAATALRQGGKAAVLKAVALVDGLDCRGACPMLWQGKPLAMLYNEPGLHFALVDPQARAVSLIAPRGFGAPELPLKNMFSMQRPIWRGGVHLAWDARRETVYAAEAGSFRVLASKVWDWACSSCPNARGTGLEEPDALAAAAKGPGVRRVVILSDSMAMVTDAKGGEIPRFRSFPLQAEGYLNLLSSLRGQPANFEVLRRAWPLGVSGGGLLAKAIHQGAWLKDKQADEVVVTLGAVACLRDLFAFTFGSVADDLPSAEPDATESVATDAERSFGPGYKALAENLRANLEHYKDVVGLDKRGERLGIDWDADVLKLYEDPLMKPHWQALFSRLLAALSAQMKLAGVKRCTLVIVPMRNEVSLAEVYGGGRAASARTYEGLLARFVEPAAQREGMRVIDLGEGMRRAEPMFLPLYKQGDDHLTERGHQTLAFLLAWSLLEQP